MSELDDIRRLRVASLHLRGLAPLEIHAAVKKSGLPAELDVVCADIAFVEAVWRTEVQVTPTQHRARLLAELREARRAAWAASDLKAVLQSLKQEAELEIAPPEKAMLRLS